MSAEVLREAAALMRTRAKAANTIAWYVPETLVRGKSLDPVDEEVDAAFIASMSPAVALAVADWLDACALVTEVAPDRHKGLALAVARAYMGAEQ
jgi:hypothetical protein